MYPHKIIFKALVLTPVPIQLLLSLLFTVLNREFNMDALVAVMAVNLVIYLVFCIVIVPFAYVIAIYLNRKNRLNIISIMLGSLLIWFLLSLCSFLLFTGSLATPWWRVLIDFGFYATALVTGGIYWAILTTVYKRHLNSTAK